MPLSNNFALSVDSKNNYYPRVCGCPNISPSASSKNSFKSRRNEAVSLKYNVPNKVVRANAVVCDTVKKEKCVEDMVKSPACHGDADSQIISRCIEPSQNRNTQLCEKGGNDVIVQQFPCCETACLVSSPCSGKVSADTSLKCSAGLGVRSESKCTITSLGRNLQTVDMGPPLSPLLHSSCNTRRRASQLLKSNSSHIGDSISLSHTVGNKITNKIDVSKTKSSSISSNSEACEVLDNSKFSLQETICSAQPIFSQKPNSQVNAAKECEAFLYRRSQSFTCGQKDNNPHCSGEVNQVLLKPLSLNVIQSESKETIIKEKDVSAKPKNLIVDSVQHCSAGFETDSISQSRKKKSSDICSNSQLSPNLSLKKKNKTSSCNVSPTDDAGHYPLDLAKKTFASVAYSGSSDDDDDEDSAASEDESLSCVSRCESLVSCSTASAMSQDDFTADLDEAEDTCDFTGLESEDLESVNTQSHSSVCKSPFTDIASEGLSQLSMHEVLGEIHGEEPIPPLLPSLFASVPPVLNFCLPGQCIGPLPSSLKKLLKWRLSTITPVIVKQLISRSGFRITTKNHSWLGYWGKHMKSNGFNVVQSHQKVNHFPGSFQIGRKDRLWRNLSQMQALHGKTDFNFVPLTFVLPVDIRHFRKFWEKNCGKRKWIVKPPASARGAGIKVINKWSQIPKKRPLVVQRYLAKPYLINETKFDLRLYVYVTSYDPLRIYAYKDGLVRFASCKYSSSAKTMYNLYIHLTNYSINKRNANYMSNTDHESCTGHKWSILALWRHLTDQGIDTKPILEQINDIIVKTILSSESHVFNMIKTYVKYPRSCHELFGFDIILDEKLKPWLIEVNISPSLHSTSSLDVDIKGPMLCDLFKMAGFRLPEKNPSNNAQLSSVQSLSCIDSNRNDTCSPYLYTSLCPEEKEKRVFFATKATDQEISAKILEDLTPCDICDLVQAEDENNRRGGFQRIFPSPSSHKYFKYFETKRYTNLLLDTWVRKYHSAPQAGIELLQSLCQQQKHLRNPNLHIMQLQQPRSGLNTCATKSTTQLKVPATASLKATASSSKLRSRSSSVPLSYCKRVIQSRKLTSNPPRLKAHTKSSVTIQTSAGAALRLVNSDHQNVNKVADS